MSMKKVLIVRVKNVQRAPLLKQFPEAELIAYPCTQDVQKWEYFYKIPVEETHLLANKGMVEYNEL